MKKQHIFAFFSLVVMFFLSACTNQTSLPTTTTPTPAGTSGVQPTTGAIFSDTTSMPAHSNSLPFEYKPIDHTSPVLPVSEKLAKLTKEDGTGIVHFGMTAGEVRAILRMENIPFLIDNLGNILSDEKVGENEMFSNLFFEDGTAWSFNQDYNFWRFSSLKTQKGLQIGDSVSKMKQLYGEEDFKSKGSGSNFSYWCSYAVDKAIAPYGVVIFSVGVDKEDDDAVVRYLHIMQSQYNPNDSEAGS
jgi:hypothetical protein